MKRKKKITLADIAGILKKDKTKGDTSYWGIVQSLNTDSEGNVTSYNVSLGGNTGTTKCRKLAGAKVNDTVLVTLRSTGEAVVVGTKNGDTDASDAMTAANDVADDLDENYSTTSEVEEMIGEAGGSYQIVEWARSSSNSAAPATGWSTTMPELTATYKYLWQRIVTVTGETRTVTTSAQLAKTMNGLFVFMNNVSPDSNHTTIDGGTINISNAIYTGSHSRLYSYTLGAYLGSDGVSYGSRYLNGSNYEYVLVALNKATSADDEVMSVIPFDGSEEDPMEEVFYVTADGTVYAEDFQTSTGSIVAADFVTEQGTYDDGCNYRIWDTGKKECWRNYTVSMKVDSGSGPYHNDISSISFPSSFFSATPAIQTSIACGMAGWLGRSSSASKSATGNIRVYRLSKLSTAGSITISIYAIGS